MQKTYPFKGEAFAVFKKFANLKGAFFLDSSQPGKNSERSFIGFKPSRIIVGKNLDQMKSVFAGQKKLKAKAVGYIAYEGAFHFGLYTHWIEINHAKSQIILHASTKNLMQFMMHRLKDAAMPPPEIMPQAFKTKSNFNKQTYVLAVKQALQAITRGDIYQINLSRIIESDIRVDPVLLYSALRQLSPSPFAAYYDADGEKILSSSPERFLKLKDGIVSVKPMKGTRPRGKTTAEDKRLKQDLIGSKKEIAELLMVTDLERNDLGRVCQYGSVKVKAMRTIETYATVFQATSTIEGKLRKDCDALDLIKATFPSGSVTGCPKIEAMKIIKLIEKIPRGFYTGALGHIDPNGNMDFSVLIRSILVGKKTLRYNVGSGIVADSNPKAEYEETVLKTKAIEQAILEVTRA